MLSRQRFPSLIERQWPNLLILSLLTLLYVPLILHWIDGWVNKSISIEHEYFSHALIGFPFAAYLAWSDRKKWQRLPDQAHPLGAICLLVSVAFYATGTAELVNLSFPLMLAGLCLWFKGMPGLRLQGFPLLLVLLGTPNSVPYMLTPYTLPLQEFIAGTAGFVLLQIGIPVQVEGVYIFVNDRLVEVAPYCAGLKMLFTSWYVSLMLLYWTGAWRSRRKVITLLIGATFISVTANIVRNTLLTFFHGTGRDGAFHLLHESWGGDVYSACMLGLIVLFLNFIDRPDATLATETTTSEDTDNE
ncbi:MAG: cyanoexosortase B [Spirulinaceae cyanobacterium RM2_2_10]|nr:cyanoexosortase B [Spirulinaceae cyanobacterium SM2_1_0]NJO20618.1 cyanoexosortase B [Spirulinaceae cyanobacterium RM2_2_10]